jgi:thiol-disulfide isomerase/thioredoxin
VFVRPHQHLKQRDDLQSGSSVLSVNRNRMIVNTMITSVQWVVIGEVLALGPSEATEALRTNLLIHSPAVAQVQTRIDPSEEWKALRKAVEESNMAYYKAFDAHKESDAEDRREELWQAYRKINDANVPKVFKLVREAPTSASAFEMLEWIVTNGRIHVRSLWPYGLQAVELLREHHAANPKIGLVCAAVGRNWDWSHKPTLDLLRLVMEKNPDRTARGLAAFALARLTKQQASAESAGNKTAFGEAEQLLETVIQKYGDCVDPRTSGDGKPRLLGKEAERELFELRHLSIGRVAPELEGEDLDGQKIKLSDYRGKVLVLSFWATWCGPCMQMVPHERKLVERLKGKPFVLLGVNGDEDRAKLKPVLLKEQITWRSFWNGGADGPISTAWNARGWPAVFVLDPQGVIRFRAVQYEALDAAVDQLLKENGIDIAPQRKN